MTPRGKASLNFIPICLTAVILIRGTYGVDVKPHAMQLSSSAFQAGAEIARKYSCDGDDVSPPLRSGIPQLAQKHLR